MAYLPLPASIDFPFVRVGVEEDTLRQVESRYNCLDCLSPSLIEYDKWMTSHCQTVSTIIYSVQINILLHSHDS